MTAGNDTHFEEFAPGNGGDILDKVARLEQSLRLRPVKSVEGLCVKLLGAASPRVEVQEHGGERHDVLMLGSNSYLSLTTHPKVVEACKAACDRYGYGMGAVSLYAGTTDLHRQLEQLIAEFYQAEDCIVFPCGYSANIGVISALCGRGDVVINDICNHASIFDGSRLSGADQKVYIHGHMRHLEKQLKAIPETQRGRLIITDGVFSMDGDLAPLDVIIELARAYGARVMIDEAHAAGVVGPTGRGTAEYFGCAGQVDITVGTLSKAPGAIGGYCVGKASLISYLRYYARTYFFSTSIPAPIIAGLIEVFKLMIADQAGRDRLWHNIRYLRDGLQHVGFDTGNSQSAIIPVMIGDERKLADIHNELRHRGVFTNIVTYPAVRRKACRLRLSVMNSLTEADMDEALRVLSEVGREHGIIP
ncbi:MAG: aminotransferase class I/II-fold pyridoxal phosphate-dependent enzyme [Lentisphaerae bacterium]|jgi:4-hydroxy-2,2'-bipyrrole-5-methanol synthase|nr:aminotransferase class I/II-fold pyridoxal phosphate-dependent enzyme [Lentisphaerota bacterium]MBT4822059.1 aminotransferase class I/II-fold pyridoxal phosphate-dependent enzyme [Lentisphaerota bacterium]MBT5609143.1 aminotransferase class I/II-fold pyridoxal phosphate-dependent enzyme [Lentisphaerota bacterium]MBT7054177.1 aminotransferase class I/II-fold pyridoxal phosphate-dependent enzyme [Lentisphaerota bacterium]MBT7841059.1 aminotransferase class I/II-fold pyridoxal phosphate-depende